MSGGAVSAAFYCVADDRYFLGAVGLINSLRMVGHGQPVFVLDAGLEPAQKALLASEATLVPAPRDAPPWLLKTVAPLAHPAPVMVLIDADMIVTRPLFDLIELAAKDKVVAFENIVDRFVPEWGELLDLGSVERRTYVSSALVALGDPAGRRVLEALDACQGRVDFELTFWRENVPEYPFRYADQDVLNAVLGSGVLPADRIESLDHRLAAVPPFAGLKALDAATLRCAYDDGTEPYVVHQYLPRKPWLEPAYDGVYSRLLRRLLSASDIALRVPPQDVPLRLRSGLLASAERRRVNAREQLRWRLSGLTRQRSGDGRADRARVAAPR